MQTQVIREKQSNSNISMAVICSAGKQPKRERKAQRDHFGQVERERESQREREREERFNCFKYLCVIEKRKRGDKSERENSEDKDGLKAKCD